jgi:hypothetical protein
VVHRLDERWKRDGAALVPAADNGLVPAVYRRHDGAVAALNAAAVAPDQVSAGDWPSAISRLATGDRPARTTLSRILAVASLALLALATLTWPSRHS